MEIDDITQKQPPVINQLSQAVPTKSKRNLLLIALGVVVLLLIVTVSVYYLGSQRNSVTSEPNYQNTNNSSIEPTVPSSNSFIPYKELPKNAAYEDTEIFTESLLKVSFAYPKKYFSQSFKSDEKNPYAAMFFLKARNEEKEKHISYTIDCELSNRRNPSGICREGIVGDVEVGIIGPSTNVPAYDEDKNSAYQMCTKEVISEEKVIYSCSVQLSISPERGMRYSVYLTTEKPKAITIKTYKPLEFSDLIMSIVDSAKSL